MYGRSMTPASLMPSAQTMIFVGQHLSTPTGRGMPRPYIVGSMHTFREHLPRGQANTACLALSLDGEAWRGMLWCGTLHSIS